MKQVPIELKEEIEQFTNLARALNSCLSENQ